MENPSRSYASLGLQLVINIAVAMMLGYFLDKKLFESKDRLIIIIPVFIIIAYLIKIVLDNTKKVNKK